MSFNDFIEKSYKSLPFRVSLHILFWSCIFGSSTYFNTIAFNGYSTTAATWLLALKSTINTAAFYYILVDYLVPVLFLKKKYFLSIAGLLLLLLLYAVADAYEEKLIFQQCSNCAAQLANNQPQYYRYLQKDMVGIVLSRLLTGGDLYQLLIFLSLPIALKIGRSYFRQTVRQLQLSKENLQLEFNFLKAQVNPHFLFNTLNNIYSMVIQDKKKEAAATIARLSGFMRFALYESNGDKSSLEKEVQLLKDYIELEKLRLNQTTVEFNYETDGQDYTIPPLLFMPAFENAFKYSADQRPDSYIRMDLRALDGRLSLTMENNFDPRKTGKQGGIGLLNMQKRLRFYYPGSGTWSVTTTETIFTLTLSFLLV